MRRLLRRNPDDARFAGRVDRVVHRQLRTISRGSSRHLWIRRPDATRRSADGPWNRVGFLPVLWSPGGRIRAPSVLLDHGRQTVLARCAKHRDGYRAYRVDVESTREGFSVGRAGRSTPSARGKVAQPRSERQRTGIQPATRASASRGSMIASTFYIGRHLWGAETPSEAQAARSSTDGGARADGAK